MSESSSNDDYSFDAYTSSEDDCSYDGSLDLLLSDSMSQEHDSTGAFESDNSIDGVSFMNILKRGI